MGLYDRYSLIETLSNRTIQLTKRVRYRWFPAKQHQTVFVAGMQRSGTNMLMDVLDRSWQTTVFHETDPRAFDNYEMRPIPEIKRLLDDPHGPYVVIKSLCELDRINELMNAFSGAKVIWMVRHYGDAVASATRSFANFSPRLGRIVADRDSDGWRGRGMSDQTHALLRELYSPEMNEVSAAALKWYYRNVLFFEQGLDHNPNVHVVRYRNLVQHPDQSFSEICRFLGMSYSPRQVRFVHSSSAKWLVPDGLDERVMALCEQLTARFDPLAPVIQE